MPARTNQILVRERPLRVSLAPKLLALLPLALLLWVLTGCMGRLGPAPEVPTTVGAHPVGVTKMVVDDARRDRSLDVEVWYPAAEDAGEPAVYEVGAVGATVARLHSPTGARRDAPAWKAGGPRPVVLMSHGAGSSRFANASLSEVLASHGYIVAAPDHDGHTTADTVFGISDEERAQSAFDRPLDLSRVLDALEARSARADDLFAGLIDPDRIAVAGHSFGGRTALAMVGARFNLARQAAECARNDDDRRCRALPIFGRAAQGESYRYRDPRVSAALLIAPAGFEFYRQDGVAQIDAPVLVVGARRDRTTPFAERHQSLIGALTSPHHLLDLKDAGHLTATDVCAIVESIGFLGKAFGGDKARDGCGEGYMSTGRALEVVSGASLAFLDAYVNRVPGALARLDAALEVDERVATIPPGSTPVAKKSDNEEAVPEL